MCVRDQTVFGNTLGVSHHPGILADVRVAHIRLSGGQIWNDVGFLTCFGQGPVDGGAFSRVTQVLELDNLMAQLSEGIAAVLGCGTGM